jgi:tRNA threonylcarbamoyladenosine biosynthesis protein TsaE
MSGAHRADPAQRVDDPAAWATAVVPSAEAMRDLGGQLVTLMQAGDLVILTGGLGAGKTTLTQGIGARLMVRGDVTSPTFVIARVHPSLVGGPALVHVDAYRLETLSEVEDLDLDASLAESVTVVEWGEGLVEGLAADRLEVRLERRRGAAGPDDAEVDGDEPRTVRVRGFGRRWLDVELPLSG